MQLSSQECDRTRAPFNTVQRFILTPSSTTTPAPMVTLGPMVQFSPICAVGSYGGAAGDGGGLGSARYRLDARQTGGGATTTHHQNVAEEAGTRVQALGSALAQRLEVHAHPRQEVLGLADVHPEACRGTERRGVNRTGA